MSVHRWDGFIDRKRVADDGHVTYGASLVSADGYPQAGHVWLDHLGPPLDNPRPGMRFRWWTGKGVDRAAATALPGSPR